MSGSVGVTLQKRKAAPLSGYAVGDEIAVILGFGAASVYCTDVCNYNSSNAPVGIDDPDYEISSLFSFSRKLIFKINSFSNPSCTTPNVANQALENVETGDLAALHTTAKPKSFVLQFNNCKYLSNIRYQVNAVGTSPDASIGLLPSSPETGLAVQVRHAPSGSYVPVELGNWYDIPDSGNAAAASLPMQVAYYRIGDLSPGDVKASMVIDIEYQ